MEGESKEMTIKELVERLKEYPEDTEVLTWDPDYGGSLTITGFLYHEIRKTLEFCTDDVEG